MADRDDWGDNRNNDRQQIDYGGGAGQPYGRRFGQSMGEDNQRSSQDASRYQADRSRDTQGGRGDNARSDTYGRGSFGEDYYGRENRSFGESSGAYGEEAYRQNRGGGGGQGGDNRAAAGSMMHQGSGQNYGYRSSGFDQGRQDRNNGGDQGRDGERGWWNQTRDEVSSWFGDDEASRRRRQDEARGDHHGGKGPKGYTRFDDRIREDVNDRFTEDYLLDASDIEVAVKDGEVTLSGKIGQRSDKRRAEDLAEQVTGVKHVQNNLRVKEDDKASTYASNVDTGATGVTTPGGAGLKSN